MADAAGTLPGNRHDEPSSPRPAQILSCNLDYRTGGSLLESRPGSVSESAEDRRPNTSKPAPGHRIYPYLLRGLAVTRPNQAWAMDINYIPMARGFVYLAAVVDWFSRRVLAWRLSITMDTSFCIEALEEALSKNEKPEIFNTDQGSQFTSEAFTGRLKENGIAIQSLSPRRTANK
jgi:transposase InsO family protein